MATKQRVSTPGVTHYAPSPPPPPPPPLKKPGFAPEPEYYLV